MSENHDKIFHTDLRFFVCLLDEARVMAPVAAADQSQHERGHGVYLLGRRSRMQWAHRRQPVHGSSVMRQLVARPLPLHTTVEIGY